MLTWTSLQGSISVKLSTYRHNEPWGQSLKNRPRTESTLPKPWYSMAHRWTVVWGLQGTNSLFTPVRRRIIVFLLLPLADLAEGLYQLFSLPMRVKKLDYIRIKLNSNLKPLVQFSNWVYPLERNDLWEEEFSFKLQQKEHVFGSRCWGWNFSLQKEGMYTGKRAIVVSCPILIVWQSTLLTLKCLNDHILFALNFCNKI